MKNLDALQTLAAHVGLDVFEHTDQGITHYRFAKAGQYDNYDACDGIVTLKGYRDALVFLEGCVFFNEMYQGTKQDK